MKADDNVEIFSIKKKSVFKASPKLKHILRFLNNYIFQYADINSEVVHSYIKGKSTYTAVQPHAKSKYFFKTDISDFFNSFNILDIKKIIDENLTSVPISDISLYKNNLLHLITVNGRLPIGLSTSPSITNSALFKFDNILQAHCKTLDIVYTRYSDDLIFSCNDISSLNSIEKMIPNLLLIETGINLKLNNKKTKYNHSGNRVNILGIIISPSGKLSVASDLKKKIEALLYFYSSDLIKFESYLTKNFNGSKSLVSGQLNYIGSIDKTYLNKLRKKYGNFIVDYFYRNPEG